MRPGARILSGVDIAQLRREFATAIAGPDAIVDLLGGALAIARLGGEPTERPVVEAQLDLIARAAREHASPAAGVEALAQAIDHQLFTVGGFHGNSSDYTDPDNSYVDRVLETRSGLPITLSLIYMEVASRIGLRCDGIGYPGHFIVRCGEPEAGIYVDPFHQGQRLDREELLANIRGGDFGGASPDSLLAAVTKRQILQRMLNNLRATFQERRDTVRWYATVHLLLCIEPWNAHLTGERGMLAYRLGEHSSALEDLERYVGACEPGATARGAIRLLNELRTQLRSEERL